MGERVLLVGGGGREHALAWRLATSPQVDRLIAAPGNPGIAEVADLCPVAVRDVGGLVALAKEEQVTLAVVGPEAPLVDGLADALASEGIPTFGPRRAGARLEGSKTWAKALMEGSGIPTAVAQTFTDRAGAVAFAKNLLDRRDGGGVVVKADGLAAGKGVTVCDTLDEAQAAIADCLERGVFGEAGAEVLVEERLAGEELSILAFTDGSAVLAMEPAQDFKRAGAGDTGPNTGGMGSHSPVPSCSPEIGDQVAGEVLEPVVAALRNALGPEAYVGVLYAGIMLTEDGPKVLEFNCRFGDPETQAVLPRLSSDLMDPILACTRHELAGVRLDWHADACVAVVAASAGYPGPAAPGALGVPIRGLPDAALITGLPVFQAGTAVGADGSVVTAGGRVLAAAALGVDHGAARQRAYDGLAAVSFEGMWYRPDIGPAAH